MPLTSRNPPLDSDSEVEYALYPLQEGLEDPFELGTSSAESWAVVVGWLPTVNLEDRDNIRLGPAANATCYRFDSIVVELL